MRSSALEAELRRVTLPNVLDAVDVEVRVAASLVDLRNLEWQEPPAGYPRRPLTSIVRGGLSMSAGYAA